MRPLDPLKFKDAFVTTCADVIRYVPEFHPKNFCDRLADAPFLEYVLYGHNC